MVNIQMEQELKVIFQICKSENKFEKEKLQIKTTTRDSRWWRDRLDREFL